MKTSKNYANLISRICIASLLLVTSHAIANSVRIFTLSADEWARPRSGAVIPQLSAIRSAVGYWSKDDNRLMIIRYPGEDSGELWAAELRDWLISLGVPSDYIQMVAGAQAAEEIKLVVGDRSELEQ